MKTRINLTELEVCVCVKLVACLYCCREKPCYTQLFFLHGEVLNFVNQSNQSLNYSYF